MAEKKSNTKSKAEKPAKEVEKKPVEKPAKAKAEAKTEAKNCKKGWLFGLIAVAVLAIIGAVIAVICLNKPDASDPRAKISYSNSFFIYDNSKYTLWNADGKRVTEDEYSNAYDFVGGYSLVKKDDQYGVINENGKMTVDFGKYGNITMKGGLYLAQDGNTKEYSLITGAGRELAKGNDLSVDAASYSSGFAAVKVDGKIKIYNYAGTLIAETDVVDGAEDPTMNSSHDYGVFHYGEQNYVFDARNGAMLAQFEGSRYTFDSVSDDRRIVLLENYNDSGNYKLIADGKVYDLNETKYYGITAMDAVIGYDNYSKLALLNDDYKVAKWVSTYLDLKDTNNYAVEGENGNVEIYKNGEKVKEFGDDSSIAASGVLYEDLYAIEEGDKAMFYNLDGTVGINHEFKDIRSLFDEFHHAIVADEDNAYYLIDAKGNKIGDGTYKSISVRDGGYELKNEDGKYAIANKDGKLVTEFKYDNLYYRSYAEPRNIWTGRIENEKYDVIDVDSSKVILEGVNVDSFYANYFSVKNSDKKLEYYTYSGEKFYTSEK